MAKLVNLFFENILTTKYSLMETLLKEYNRGIMLSVSHTSLDICYQHNQGSEIIVFNSIL